MIRLGVHELSHDPDLGIRFRSVGMIVADVFPVPSHIAVGIDFRAVVDVKLLCGDTGGMNEFDLFGLAVPETGRAFESVEVVFVKSLLGHSGPRSDRTGRYRYHLGKVPATDSGLDLIHIPSHQLDARILEGLASAVAHCDPTDDVNEIALLGRN